MNEPWGEMNSHGSWLGTPGPEQDNSGSWNKSGLILFHPQDVVTNQNLAARQATFYFTS